MQMESHQCQLLPVLQSDTCTHPKIKQYKVISIFRIPQKILFLALLSETSSNTAFFDKRDSDYYILSITCSQNFKYLLYVQSSVFSFQIEYT